MVRTGPDQGGGGVPEGPPSLRRHGVIVYARVWSWQHDKVKATHLNLSQLVRDLLDHVLGDAELLELYAKKAEAERDAAIRAAETARAHAEEIRSTAIERLRPTFAKREGISRKHNLTWVRALQQDDRALRQMDPLEILDRLEGR